MSDLDLPFYLMTFGLIIGAYGLAVNYLTVAFVGFVLWFLMGVFGLTKILIQAIKLNREKEKKKC